jgi:hypothetical protein
MNLYVIEIRSLHRIFDATEAIDHKEMSASFMQRCLLKLAVLRKE